jgi:hypothetical protein
MTAPAPYQVMPPLSPDEYAALKVDIALRGVQVPVEYDERDNELDGHHRIQICGELGITQWPRLIRRRTLRVVCRRGGARQQPHDRCRAADQAIVGPTKSCPIGQRPSAPRWNKSRRTSSRRQLQLGLADANPCRK